MKRVVIFVRGQAAAEPGPAAIAVRAVGDGEVLVEFAESIGNATSEYAEYVAAMKGLQATADFLSQTVDVVPCKLCLSQDAVKKKLNHEETITHPGLVPLFIEIHNVRVTHFPQLQLGCAKGGRAADMEQLVMGVLDGQ